MKPALARWLKIVFIWQVVVVALSGAYVALMASSHARGYAWVAPPIAAVFGTALPLQATVMAIMRAGKGS
jgi:hypothetical protein